MRIRAGWCALMILFAAVTVLAQPKRPQPKKQKCELLCAARKQYLQTEAAEVAAAHVQRYLAIDSHEAVLRLRLLNPSPEVNHPAPSIDDELRIYVNGKQVWEMLYASAANHAGTEFTLTADQLPLRKANIVLRWRNTSGPDAHLFLEIGGSLVCPTDGWCNQVYREGLTFGPRNLIAGPFGIGFSIPRSEADLINAWAWRSSVNPYAAECNGYPCK